MKRFLLTRETGRWTDIIVIAGILSFALEMAGAFISVILFKLTGFDDRVIDAAGSEAVGRFMTQYWLFLGVWITALFAVIVFKRNRPMLKCFLPWRGGNGLRGIIIGLLLGFLSNGFCVLMSWLNGDIRLYFNGFQPKVLLLFFAAVLIQSGAEELGDRWYLYQKLRRGYSQPWIAILGNAVVFMLLHLTNSGITALAAVQIVVVGVLFSLFVYYYDALWTAIMMHTAWNFTQNIIFGLPNSGIVSEYSIFRLEAASARNGLFYNVNFGVEGSAGAVAVIALICIAVIIRGRGKGEKLDVWKNA